MPDIHDIAADPNGAPLTETLQSLIDSGTAPLHIRFGAGRHVSGGIRLRSDLTLELDAGAELHFIPEYDAYAHTPVDIVAEESDRAMMVAKGARNIAIIGSGRIFGDGATKFIRGKDLEMGTLTAMKLRPRVVVLDACDTVRIEGIAIDDSPMWTLHLAACSNVAIKGVRVDNDRRMPNTDGIVIDGCRNITIVDSSFRTADDGIVLKTTQRAGGTLTGPCENIRISNCTIESRSCALKLGTESFSDFRDIVFEDVRIEKSNRGFGIFSRDGGKVENVRVSRVTMDCSETPAGFWGSGEAITINTIDRRPESGPAGTITDIVIEDLSGAMEGSVNLVAERAGDISNVRLSRVALQQREGALGTALNYDIRPTPADRFDLFPAEPGAGRVNAWRFGPDGKIIGLIEYPGGLPGIFAKGVGGLVMEDVTVQRPDPLPATFNPQPIVEL